MKGKAMAEFRKAVRVGNGAKYHIIETAHCGAYATFQDYIRYVETKDVPQHLRCRKDGCRQSWDGLEK